MNLNLGGPGPGCSAMRVRRLAAGELAGVEKERTEAHVAGCERCAAVQRELAQETAALVRDVPFPAFAAGVAEKLAARPLKSFAQRWAPLAAAAGLALVAGALVLRPADDSGTRSKGAASAQLFVQDARGVHNVGTPYVFPGENTYGVPGFPVAEGARLMLSLRPAGRKYAAAVLIEPGEASVLYSGPAVAGALPQAFEWTGQGGATVLVVFADEPLDAAKLRGAQDAPRGADVVQVQIHR